MARNPGRPLSPHLTIWRWGPHAIVSILHRATGTAMALGGVSIFVWWLAAAASGPAAYDRFSYWIYRATDGALLPTIVNILARLAAFGLTWAFFQHLSTGVRHFVLDVGAGYELKRNKQGAVLTLVVSTVMTLLLWVPIILGGMR